MPSEEDTTNTTPTTVVDVSDETVTQSDDVSSPGIEHWPQVDPQYVLNELRALKHNAWAAGKQFYKSSSYATWTKMNPDQKAKTKAYWTTLSEPVKIACAKRAVAAEAAYAEGRHQNAEHINKHEKARILHLRMYASAQTLWTKLGQPLNREDLDCKERRQSTAQELVAMFNDKENVVFQNATVEYEDGKRKICPMTESYVPREGYDQLASHCWSIDPQAPGKPLRDSAWLLKHWKTMRSEITSIRENFKRSGNQDAENKSAEWLKFCSNYSDVHAYAIAVMPYGMMSNLGKATPDEVQRDTGILDINGKRPLSNSLAATNRRRQRSRRKEMTKSGSFDELSSVGTSSGSSPSNGVESILSAQVENNARMESLKFLALHGSEIMKKRAFSEISKLAFGDSLAPTELTTTQNADDEEEDE